MPDHHNQALAEFFVVATSKLGMPEDEAAAQVRDWMILFPGIEATREALAAALAEAEAGRFAFWDALLLATAEGAGCTMVFSEDMQDGARVGGVTVRTPFANDGLSHAAQVVLNPSIS